MSNVCPMGIAHCPWRGGVFGTLVQWSESKLYNAKFIHCSCQYTLLAFSSSLWDWERGLNLPRMPNSHSTSCCTRACVKFVRVMINGWFWSVLMVPLYEPVFYIFLYEPYKSWNSGMCRMISMTNINDLDSIINWFITSKLKSKWRY